ncbi:SMI1/KNR4 family protein [Streptomyces sp. NPDC058320]|uniref:SMI1/KNR4 family protein n=1 Tax=unclassified Streptomyces TaxID=2593676 RepID=UPI003635A056
MNQQHAREAEKVRQAWGRVTRWLERHAPRNAAALGEPAGPKMISEAEGRLGVSFPQQMWTWLLTHNGVRRKEDHFGGSSEARANCFLPSGWHLLSVEEIVAVYEWRTSMAAMQPSPHPTPECLGWHRNWIPFAVESDWLYGWFVDASTGVLGSWSDGDLNELGTHDDLAEYFHDLADEMRLYGKVEDGELAW